MGNACRTHSWKLNVPTHFLYGKLEEKRHSEDLPVDAEMTLKHISKYEYIVL
jgi:hypothetical protein